MSKETIQIKRYPNRRFYARNTSKYVSLPELEAMIREGNQLEIRDSQSGDDITRQVLAQIILDRQPEKVALFPTDMLHFMLRSNELMSDFLRDYFRQSLTYLDYLQRHGATAKNRKNPMHWARAWLDEMTGKQGAADAAPDDAKNPAPEVAQNPEPSPQLLSRVEQLEERIRQLEAEASSSDSRTGMASS